MDTLKNITIENNDGMTCSTIVKYQNGNNIENITSLKIDFKPMDRVKAYVEIQEPYVCIAVDGEYQCNLGDYSEDQLLFLKKEFDRLLNQ